MAQKVRIELLDDLDGTSAADETVTFGLDGINYEIDLTSKHAAKLRDALAQYVGAARKTGKAGKRAGGRAATGRTGPEPKAVREWAKEQGIEVPDRGRIPAEVSEQYAAAHPDAA